MRIYSAVIVLPENCEKEVLFFLISVKGGKTVQAKEKFQYVVGTYISSFFAFVV